jgi:predicted DNA-binding protein with PD1-like motif
MTTGLGTPDDKVRVRSDLRGRPSYGQAGTATTVRLDGRRNPPGRDTVAVMRTLAVRLRPGEDLKEALAALVAGERIQAGYILTCVGSLGRLALRLAGARRRYEAEGSFEIVSLVGTLGQGDMHVHLSASDAEGRTLGGHLINGCVVRTTAELVVAVDERYVFDREPDPGTGFAELVVRERPAAAGTD